uniref:Uncharacterized protein n=1 Tax=Plectus sambesii TaxID=2011161 RepID=A0A914XED1_9BILA
MSAPAAAETTKLFGSWIKKIERHK